MKVGWLATVTFLGSLLISGGLSNTLAIDSNGRYFALGVGSRSCSDHLKVSEKRLENFTPEQYEIADVIIEHWVAGFFTAHNFYVTDTFDVVGTVTIDQLQERIEKYCRANPNKRVAEAIVAIAQELHANRIKVDTTKGEPARVRQNSNRTDLGAGHEKDSHDAFSHFFSDVLSRLFGATDDAGEGRRHRNSYRRRPGCHHRQRYRTCRRRCRHWRGSRLDRRRLDRRPDAGAAKAGTRPCNSRLAAQQAQIEQQSRELQQLKAQQQR